MQKANNAKVENAHASVKETMRLEYSEYVLEKSQGQSTKNLIEYLQDKKIIGNPEEDGKYKIDVEKLLKTKSVLGMGTDEKDVYVLEKVTDDTDTGNLGKIASIKILKLADTKDSNTIKYELNYYGNSEKENCKIDVLKDEFNESIGKNITFNLAYEGNKRGPGSWVESCSAKEGMTLEQWFSSQGYGIDRYPDLWVVHGYAGGIAFWEDQLDIPIEDGKTYFYGDIGECVSGDGFVMVSVEGKTVLARDVEDGQDIVFYNFEKNSVEVGTVKKAYGYDSAKNFIKYQFDDNTILKVTDYHPIYTKEGWKSYTRRNGYPIPKVGDEVKTVEGWKKITNIEELSTFEDCYNFLIKTKSGESVRNFFANNTLVEAVTRIE